MDSVWLDGLEATPEAPRRGRGCICEPRGGGLGRAAEQGAGLQRQEALQDLGAWGAGEAWVQLFRPRPSPEWPLWDCSGLCAFPSGMDSPAFGSKVKHECWEEGEKERSGFKMLSVLNINGNMFLKHSIFRGGLSPGPRPSLYQMNGFAFLPCMHTLQLAFY